MIIYEQHKSDSRENLEHLVTLVVVATCSCESYKHSALPEKQCKHTRRAVLGMRKHLEHLEKTL